MTHPSKWGVVDAAEPQSVDISLDTQGRGVQTGLLGGGLDQQDAGVHGLPQRLRGVRRPPVERAEVAWVLTADEELFRSLEDLTPDLWDRVLAAHGNGATVALGISSLSRPRR